MTLPRIRTHTARTAALTVGLALSLPSALVAQPGPGLSSGSGEGTGTGRSSGIQRNESRSVSGTDASNPVPGTRSPGVPQPARTPQPRRPGYGVPMGPGANTTFPNEVGIVPFASGPVSEAGGPGGDSTVQPAQLAIARSLSQPGERSIALQRVANGAIFSNQLPMARQALREAADAALREPVPLIRDQRLIAIITSAINLAEADLREGKLDLSVADAEPSKSSSTSVDRLKLIDRAQDEWRLAADLAGRIANPTYRSEMTYRVVDNQAYGSQTVVNEFPGGDGYNASGSGATAPTAPALNARADRILSDAAAAALRIERPAWRDRALVQVAVAAASSKQYGRGLAVARLIPQPEVRTDALVRLAESQARHKDDAGATAVYQEAARSVAAIPEVDLRTILAAVLIDNLISVGRFDDARAMVVLAPREDLRWTALGAIAESQGRRGAAQSALAWINRDVPPERRDNLLRRLNNGVLLAIEGNRSRDVSNRDR